MADELNSTLLIIVLIAAGAMSYGYVEMNKLKWKNTGMEEYKEDYDTLLDNYVLLNNQSRQQNTDYNSLVKSYNQITAYYNPDKGQLWNLTLEKKDFTTMGIYYGGQFYCVWAEGRDLNAIRITEDHEIMHALIHENPEHFCGSYWNETNVTEGR